MRLTVSARRPHAPSVRARSLFAVAALSAAALGAVGVAGTSTAAAAPDSLKKNAIKHVWLIILENKSYDASFTGLNKNSYLWSTLPKQGALLTQYYGTGHYSQDNYESMVSGQAPEQDTQADCDVAATSFSSNALVDGAGSLTVNPNYGQAVSAAGPNAADGQNGCVYPSGVPTLFNQLDLAGRTWKGYAQDLHDQPGREDGPCGYPGTAANAPTSNTIGPDPKQGPTQLNNAKAYPGVASFTGVQAAGNDAAGRPGAKEDGYVAKHFPMPWFHSLTDGTTTPADGGSDCDAAHIANLDDPTQGLVHDLQSSATTPAFSWITPNNCSDAHDAVCKGNNLSGAFTQGRPDYRGVGADPRKAAPTNYTGGLYASDLFLQWYVPLIEQSAAFKDGGLIDITFDEANPPFVNNSFNNANDPGYAVHKAATAATYLQSDAAGENVYGRDVSTEPAGPNTPLTRRADGTPNPGPGDNGFIDRVPKGPAAHAAATAAAGASTISDNAILATDPGRTVTGNGIPAGSYVGAESNVGPSFPTSNTGSVTAGSFSLVDVAGHPVTTTGPVSGIALGAQSADPAAKNHDPILDTTDFTPGGGDTGSVLISPYIRPGTVSSTSYNHYSWLRTIEDLFGVGTVKARKDQPAAVGAVARGLDGEGHLGYAAQPGLRPFGPDIFTNPKGRG